MLNYDEDNEKTMVLKDITLVYISQSVQTESKG